MFNVLDPFIDFKCPHCEKSLRWKIVSRKAQIGRKGLVMPYHCPLCSETIVEARHPAIADNWLWSKFYLPGVLLCALGLFIPSIGWLLPFAVFTLIAGFIALIAYMIKERIGWKVYVPFDHDL